jgi:hypothetical protein
MTNHERTERSTAAGLHPEAGKAGGPFQGRLAAALGSAAHIEEGRLPGVLATVLPVGAVFGPWFGPAGGRGWLVLFATAVVALTALLQFLWLHRARSARRWRAALDAYAAREIAGDRRRKAPSQ